MSDRCGLRFEPLRAHDRSQFSCGESQLDKYFRERAGQDQRRNIANCFVMVHSHDDEIIGYYTLSASTHTLIDLPEHLSQRLPRYPNLPAILLGRLAISSKHQGKGYGRQLLMNALQRAREATRHIAAFAVVVDAKDDTAIAFYERLGFVRFKSSPNRLFLPFTSISGDERTIGSQH